MLIFEKSVPDRKNTAQITKSTNQMPNISVKFLRQQKAILPEVSELQAVRHYTQLSTKNFSIDTHFYPLGSCTMKYNPRGANKLAMLAGFLGRHPAAHPILSQGIMACLFDLQEELKTMSGMVAVSLTPAAGAQGEFAGMAMIRAYHDANNDNNRTEIIVPDAAHGTNPASAVMCGYKIVEIPTNKQGNVSLAALKAATSDKTAGIMLTNPSTVGVFDQNVGQIAQVIHAAGGLLYYDGANLNAILGKTNPGIMSFDVLHINVHKTFSTPHGGGGPGAGPVGVSKRLLPFLPIPMVAKKNDEYIWLTKKECPQTIGSLSAFAGNIGVLLRAYAYIKMLGSLGMERVAEYSVLNANYLQQKMQKSGFDLAYPERLATHEFIVTLKKLAKNNGITATDFAKRMLDYGVHAPTVYFPLLIAECMLIEPTETEDKQTLDYFIEVMQKILNETKNNPELLISAPHTMPAKRLDDVKAAKELNLKWVAE